MVGFQVVDLLAEDEHPEVFAEELYRVEGVGEAGAVFAESIPYLNQLLLKGKRWEPRKFGGEERERQTVPRALGLRDTLAFLVYRKQHLALPPRPFSMSRSHPIPLQSHSSNYRLPSVIVEATSLLWGEGRRGRRAR